MMENFSSLVLASRSPVACTPATTAMMFDNDGKQRKAFSSSGMSGTRLPSAENSEKHFSGGRALKWISRCLLWTIPRHATNQALMFSARFLGKVSKKPEPGPCLAVLSRAATSPKKNSREKKFQLLAPDRGHLLRFIGF